MMLTWEGDIPDDYLMEQYRDFDTQPEIIEELLLA